MANKKLIMEEDVVTFAEYKQLSYYDEPEPEPEVMLFVDDKFIGYIKVWLDSEEHGREYICLNYEIVYLDTIRKTNIK